MAQFRKLPVLIFAQLITAALIAQLQAEGKADADGRLITIDSSTEGGQGLQPLPEGYFLLTNPKGEQYTNAPDVFTAYEGVAREPGFYRKRQTQETVVDAIRVDFSADLHRPDWEHGVQPGGYLVFLADNDQYFVQPEVFAETYEPLDETAVRYMEGTRRILAELVAGNTASAAGA